MIGFMAHARSLAEEEQGITPETNEFQKPMGVNLVKEMLLLLSHAKFRNVQVTHCSLLPCYKPSSLTPLFPSQTSFHFCNSLVVDCEWNAWNNGTCTKSCGGGSRNNTRTEKTSVAFGGDKCVGPASIIEACNAKECPGNENSFLLLSSLLRIFLAS